MPALACCGSRLGMDFHTSDMEKRLRGMTLATPRLNLPQNTAEALGLKGLG